MKKVIFRIIAIVYLSLITGSAITQIGDIGNCKAMSSWDIVLVIGFIIITMFIGYSAGKEAERNG